MKILLTGFEPFGDSPINPSQTLVKALEKNKFNGVEITSSILPVDQEQGPATILAAVESLQPDAVLALGLAMGRSEIALERVAVNLLDDRIPDNAGNQVSDQPIIPDGPAAYFSTLPLRRMFEQLSREGIPVTLSLSAGSFLCNQVFYSLMHHLSLRQRSIPAGFIHLPALPEQAAGGSQNIPSMDFGRMKHAAEVLIEILAEEQV